MTGTAVLLPARIETVLDRPDGQDHWFLRFRLIPDVVSIVPVGVGVGETDGLAGATGTREWASRVEGFPDSILMRVERSGEPPLETVLNVDTAALVLPSTEADLADAASADRIWDPVAHEGPPPASVGPWWLSYGGAVAAGIGGSFDLGTSIGEITAVYAVGVAAEPAAPILAAHARRDRLARVAIGTPTNAVAGDPPAVLDLVDEANAGAVLDAQDSASRVWLVSALWSALFGDALTEVFGAPHDRVDELGEWCAQWLAPDGLHTALAVRDVPYGVFAATDLDRLQPLPDDPPSTRISPYVADLVALLAGGAEGRPADDSEVAELVELLSRQASSGRFRVRTATDVLPNQSVDALFTAAVAGLEAVGVVPAMRHLLPARGSEPFPHGVLLGDDAELDYLVGMNKALDTALGQSPMVADPAELPSPARSGGLFVKVLDRSIRADVAHNDDAAVRRLRQTQSLLAQMVARQLDGIEAGTRGLVDAAGQRIDPWAVGIAEQRWQAAGGSASSPVGIYGWVDGPITPVKRVGAYTLAPSVQQATVAAIALDRHLTHGDPDAERWRMTLDSAAIRTADELAEELRAGVHLSDAVARRILRWAPEQLREDLIDAHPRGSSPTTPDGAAILQSWTNQRAQHPDAIPDLGVGELPARMIDELDRLMAGIDAYTDLLLLDGLQQVVDGRPDLAKARLDASAGLATPPPFDVLRTPRTATDARTVMLAAVPFVSLRADPATAYAAADPSTSAYLNAVGLGQDLGFAIEVAGAAAGAGAVDVHDLGIDAATAAVTAPSVLEVAVRVRRGLGEEARIFETPALTRLRRRAHALTGEVPQPTSSELPVVDDPSELRARLVAVISIARSLVTAGVPAAGLAAADRGRLLGFSLTPRTDAEHAAVLAQLATRIDAARRVAADPDIPGPRIASAIRELLGASDSAMPVSRGAALPSRRTATADVLDDWLGTLSAVRARAAVLDVELLSSTDVELALSEPDPWLRGGHPTRTLISTFGPGGVDDDRAAVTVVDSFAESLPDAKHDVGMAFHMDAPCARAPQAILLAVAADPDAGDLDAPWALLVVKAARRLAHARMFQLQDDPVVAALSPTALFPPAPRQLKLNGRLP